MTHNEGDTQEVVRDTNEQGMSTAEYAVGTVGACGFGGLLFSALTSETGQTILSNIFDKIGDVLPF